MKKIFVLIFTLSILISSFIGLLSLNKTNIENEKEKDVLSFKNSEEAIENNSSGKDIRKAAVAGSFYPSGEQELGIKIDELLKKSPKLIFQDKIRILIAPHAGLQYSGLVSAYGFNQLKDEDYSRVILLGSSHTAAFDYFAVDDSVVWETPLGQVEVDRGFVETLVNGKSIRLDRTPHVKEHSLELELIFLQSVFHNFKIVPILTGQVDEGHISLLAQKLAYNFDDETLLLVSSDLSHYPDWETANSVDKDVISSILTGKYEQFTNTLSGIDSKGHKNLETAACAHDAISVALKLAESVGIERFDRLKYQNSGDVTEDKNRVVGYTSIVASSSRLSEYSLNIDDEAKEEMSKIARDTLENYLTRAKIPDFEPKNDLLKQPLGVFVTLTKDGQLRGCIGEFEPTMPLSEVIKDIAVKSATKDVRFKPVSAAELDDIEIEISVMTPKRKVLNWHDIRLGVDGVVVQKGLASGTFLPQVATDNNWGLEEFLSQLCTQKVKLQADCYKDPSVNLYSFEVTSFKEEKIHTDELVVD